MASRIMQGKRLVAMVGISAILLAACGQSSSQPGGQGQSTTQGATETRTATPAPPTQTVQLPATVSVATILPTSAPTAPSASPTSASMTPTMSGSIPSGWKLYRNSFAGYEVAYPSNWKARREPSSGATVFLPRGGVSGITVAMGKGPKEPPGVRVMNRLCHDVNINGLQGRRCIDTVSFSVTTTLSKGNKSFVISMKGRANQDIYNRFVSTFRLVG